MVDCMKDVRAQEKFENRSSTLALGQNELKDQMFEKQNHIEGIDW